MRWQAFPFAFALLLLFRPAALALALAGPESFAWVSPEVAENSLAPALVPPSSVANRVTLQKSSRFWTSDPSWRAPSAKHAPQLPT